MPKTSLGKELERLRSELIRKTNEKWTQKKVAEKIGVTAQAYQNWMHGRRGKELDLGTLWKINETLQGDFSRLVRLARPDLYMYCTELCKEKHSQDLDMYPPDISSLISILLDLRVKKRSEFNKLKKIIEIVYY
ncbi:MAG: helix-turn-helix domain-containing protein [Candidatus Methylomirabilis sp.]|nr:helix-turn-helix domain-containing protein [Deltaproteobacteria bacterium]